MDSSLLNFTLLLYCNKNDSPHRNKFIIQKLYVNDDNPRIADQITIFDGKNEKGQLDISFVYNGTFIGFNNYFSNNIKKYIQFHFLKYILKKSILNRHNDHDNYYFAIKNSHELPIDKARLIKDVFYLLNNECPYDELTLCDKMSFLNITPSIIKNVPNDYYLCMLGKNIAMMTSENENDYDHMTFNGRTIKQLYKQIWLGNYVKNVIKKFTPLLEKVNFIQTNCLSPEDNTLYQPEETNEHNFTIVLNDQKSISLNRLFFNL